MKIFKKASFLLPVLSLIICIHNLSGNDDKNLLLFLTSPLLLRLNSWLTDLHYSMNNELLFNFILYCLHFFSWLIAGLFIDWLRKKYKTKRRTL